MKKLIALLLTLLLCLISAAPLALAEDAASIDNPTEDAGDDDWNDDDIEWLYEEDEFDEEESIDELFSEIDADDELVHSLENEDQQDLEAAMEVYSWFALEPLDVDEAQPDSSGSMWRVLDERFNTKQQMMDMLQFYFSDELVNELWNAPSNPYQEIDGYLYTSGDGRGIDERIGDIEVSVTSKTDSRIELEVRVLYNEPDEFGTEDDNFHYVRELIDGEWKYTQFPFFW